MDIKYLPIVCIVFSLAVPALAEAVPSTVESGSAAVSSAAAASSGAGQQLEGFNLNGYTSTGKKAWDINGDKADISDTQINVTNVNANFYNPKDNANLTSKTGVIDKTNGDVHLQDDVVITSQERGTTMTTDSLDWKRNQDLVTTEDPVKIEDQQGTVTGVGLTAHPSLKTAQLNEDVKALINTTKDTASATSAQTVEITCTGPMQMDQARMYAVFNDNVVASEPSTGRRLYADKMQVWFDDKNKKIKKVICSGSVKVIQGNNVSYADEMVYNGADETLVMTGRPKLVFDTGDQNGKGMFQKMGK